MPQAPTERDTERNFRLNVAEGVAVMAAGAFLSQSAILPLFVAHFTDAKWALSLIPAVASMCVALPQLLGAAQTAHSRSLWAVFCWQAWLPRLAVLTLCLAPFLPGQWALVGFFAAFALYQGLMGLNAPCWFEMVAHVIPTERRGAFFGLRNTYGGAISVGALSLASWLLAGLPHPWSFAACFAAAALLVNVSLALMLRTRFDWAPVDAVRQGAAPFHREAWALLREHRNFRRYVFARLLLSGSVMGAAYYAVTGMERFHLSAAQSSLFALALVYAPTMVGLVWGRLADGWGNKRLQVPAALAAAAANCLLVVAPTLPLYVGGLFVVGCANVIMSIVDSKWLIELDRQRCTATVSFFNLALVPSTVLLAVAAGALAQAFGVAAVFIATACALVLGAAALALGVDEQRPAPAPAPAARPAA